MPRTNAALIAGIIEVDNSIPLDPFILAATGLVDLIPTLGSEKLTVIETWLAAHFYATRDPRVSSEHAGSVSSTYQSRLGLFLLNSHYGQTALLLDTTGTLAALNGDISRSAKTGVEPTYARTAGVTWLGGEEGCAIP